MSYRLGFLLLGDRKSGAPMAVRFAPDNIRRMLQSVQHVVTDTAWSDLARLSAIWQRLWPSMTAQSPVAGRASDNTGFPK
ncbi:MAG: transposase [Bryobacterales bacterium]|nr:transposase [Bryobacterales bacterium]